MHTPHRHHSPARRGHPLRAAALTLVLVLVTAFLPSSSADAEPGEAGPEQPATGADAGTAPGQRVITLVTGDVVGWQRTTEGTESAWIVEPAAGSEAESAQVYTKDGEAHVVPAEAAPYLRSGRLDKNLFNISHLVRQGLDDQDSSTLPLLMEAAGGPSANRAPVTPTGARTVRELGSIKTRSVLVDKDRMRVMWEEVRGRTAAREDAADARLAGAGRLWLNERVYANLDESVPQIGAPQAWSEGYDGTGIQVAVLDSGWDPAHPDLDGVVVESRNFTQEEDPEGSTGLDRNGHGTHVAATVAGAGAAAEADRRGVAPGAELIIGKVLNSTGAGWSDEIIAGMEWAAGTGAEVVNMSLGTIGASDGQDPFSQAVNILTESTGTLFVVSAGNSGPGETTIGAPGAADLALTVGAVDKEDEAASFSSPWSATLRRSDQTGGRGSRRRHRGCPRCGDLPGPSDRRSLHRVERDLDGQSTRRRRRGNRGPAAPRMGCGHDQGSPGRHQCRPRRAGDLPRRWPDRRGGRGGKPAQCVPGGRLAGSGGP